MNFRASRIFDHFEQCLLSSKDHERLNFQNHFSKFVETIIDDLLLYPGHKHDILLHPYRKVKSSDSLNEFFWLVEVIGGVQLGSSCPNRSQIFAVPN